MTTLTTLMAVYSLLGVFIYWLDGRFGLMVYTWFYGLTHENKLDPGIKKAFVVGQPASRRVSVAVSLVLLQAFSMVWIGGADILNILMYLVPEAVALVAGFYAAPFVLLQWRKKDVALEYLDKVERGDINLREDIGKGVRAAAQKAVKVVSQYPVRPSPVVQAREESINNQTKEPQAESAGTVQDVDPEAYLRKYLDRS